MPIYVDFNTYPEWLEFLRRAPLYTQQFTNNQLPPHLHLLVNPIASPIETLSRSRDRLIQGDGICYIGLWPLEVNSSNPVLYIVQADHSEKGFPPLNYGLRQQAPF